MSAQCNSDCLFGTTLAVGWRGVEQVYTVGNGIVHHLIDLLLVQIVVGIFSSAIPFDSRETHTTKTKQRNIGSVHIFSVGHFSIPFFL